MPIFRSPATTDVHYLSYQVIAMQLRYGERPTSGHYRTILLGQPSFGKDCQWITEDGCTPAHVLREHDSAMYLIYIYIYIWDRWKCLNTEMSSD